MGRIMSLVMLALLFAAPAREVAFAKAEGLITDLPIEALPVSDYFYEGQAVYDDDGNQIADVNDVLLGKDGKVVAVIIGIGGLLGAGEKNLAVAFSALRLMQKDHKDILVLDVPKERLELAPGFDLDRAKRRWVPAEARLIEPKTKD